MVDRGPTALVLALLVLSLPVGCRNKEDEPGGKTQAGAADQAASPSSGLGLSAPVSDAVSRSLHLRIYPDMAVPGREVVIEVQVVPDLVGEQPQFAFSAPQDPCGGALDVAGNRLVYRVPSDCRGSGITFVAAASGSFGRLEREVRLDIKKAVFMESVVFSYPVPGQKVASPVAVWWDRTLYLNRHESLSFVATRAGEKVVETGTVSPDLVLELDLPPSPEPVQVVGRTSSGTEETAQLRVHERIAPSWPGSIVMLDPFTDAERTGTGTTRDLIEGGGKCQVGLGRRVGPAGETAFMYLQYHVSKQKLLGKGDAFIGFSERVGSVGPASEYDQLVLWMKGDAVHTPASPVHVRIEGSNGSKRTFKIKRLQDHWRRYHFPVARTLRRGASEELRRIQVYVDSKDVSPPLGTLLFGAMYLEPFPKQGTEPAAEAKSE
ncbi:MAG: hypothetical protein FJ109_07400 [Deltaproteobacteria bacterium]|nr:hypothetical protein [Deltaproteobacteria bacterium]